ncbi:Serine/threonine-protein kinase PknD [Mycobacterium basiliense]|uniref:Serine/threonine-protein kinase PknD n=1 Tax=Mycobacterium basiliense TaxID=2094119 RepID=A0A447G7U5_9MYCO|nr:hypothetical protein [Mycobacterium basiliense]VDM86578.1 Serine/threonine-protein kinase PknD [Mycobacterium basiliense]
MDVTDVFHDRVQALTTSDKETVLPFTGLKSPQGLAVDHDGAVLVVDAGNRRVLKLPAR